MRFCQTWKGSLSGRVSQITRTFDTILSMSRILDRGSPSEWEDSLLPEGVWLKRRSSVRIDDRVEYRAIFQTVLDPGFIAVYNLFYSSQPVLALGGTLVVFVFLFINFLFWYVPTYAIQQKFTNRWMAHGQYSRVQWLHLFLRKLKWLLIHQNTDAKYNSKTPLKKNSKLFAVSSLFGLKVSKKYQ